MSVWVYTSSYLSPCLRPPLHHTHHHSELLLQDVSASVGRPQGEGQGVLSRLQAHHGEANFAHPSCWQIGPDAGCGVLT